VAFVFPGLVYFPLSQSCILIMRNCPNAMKLLRVPRRKAHLFQVDLSVVLNELTWYTESACEDVLEFITADPITPADIIAGDGLWELMSIAWNQSRCKQ